MSARNSAPAQQQRSSLRALSPCLPDQLSLWPGDAALQSFCAYSAALQIADVTGKPALLAPSAALLPGTVLPNSQQPTVNVALMALAVGIVALASPAACCSCQPAHGP